jgi:hypothetical protein
MLIIQNNEEEIDNKIDNMSKFVKLKCKSCDNQLNKSFLQFGNVLKIKDDCYGVKPFHLKTISYSNKLKFRKGGYNSYLYENVNCTLCDSKIGRFIKTCTKENWNIIGYVIFNNKHIIT